MRSTCRQLGVLTASAVLALFCATAAGAACNPASCDAVAACGSKECIGVTCETFFEDAGVPCRSAAGVCDVAESCSGASLSCPTDKKKSASTVCRGSAGECDAAEHCSGTSAACPADVGITPTIDSVNVLERRISSASGESRVLSVELDGANLCSAAYDAPATFGATQPIGNETLGARLVLHFPLPDAVILPSDTYSFVVNRGAVAGSLPFVPGAPNQGVVIQGPLDGATVGAIPGGTFGSNCTNCEILRTWVSAGDDLEPIGAIDSFDPFILVAGYDLAALAGMPAGLAAGSYGFEVEVVDGAVVANQSFAGDASGATFEYVSGTSDLAAVDFSVPEADGPASAWTAAAALAGCARVRRRRRAGSVGGRGASMRVPRLFRFAVSVLTPAALSLLLPFAAARAACNPATCDAVSACGFKECIGVTCETFVEDAGVPCRSAAGVCDVAETCSGNSVACPSDKKKSAATVCRPSTGDCDATEHCTGASASCPADVGITPVVDTVSILERRISSPARGASHALSVVLDGANLCTAAVDAPATFFATEELGDDTPQPHLSAHFGLLNQATLVSDTFHFSINRGALAGTIAFAPGAPDAGLDVNAPAQGAVVDEHASATITIGCTNCEQGRVWLTAGEALEPIGITAFYTPPFGAPTDLPLAVLDDRSFPEGLAAGSYGFEAEVIDGVFDPSAVFGGDPSGAHFTLFSGTSDLVSIDFSVPEPSGAANAWAAGAALACCARMRGTRRRRR